MATPTATQQSYQVYTDINALNDLRVQARQDEKAALKPVAQQFEALFIEEVLKQSRKVKLDDGWLDGKQADFYKEMYDKQLAQSLATKESLGLADMMVEQLASPHPVMTQSEFEAFRQKNLENQSAGEIETQPTQLTADRLALKAKIQE